MMRLMLIALVALSGCVETRRAVDKASLVPAERAAIEAVFTRFPEIPKQLTEPVAKCVIANATPYEVSELAGDAVTGVDEGTATLVRTILTRPDAIQCMTSAAQAAGVTL